MLCAITTKFSRRGRVFLATAGLVLCLLAVAWHAEAKEKDAAEPSALPENVLVEIFEEGLSPERAWPEQDLEPTETYSEQALALFRLPQRYVETGVRADRANPLLVRASASVSLPAGKHRLLLRGHGAARLWMDAAVVATLPLPKPITDGHDPVAPATAPRVPTLRLLAAGDREIAAEIESPGGSHHFVLETMLGGRRGTSPLRIELGETSASICLEGTDHFVLLSPSHHVPLTEQGWRTYAAERNTYYDRMDARRRGELRAQHQHEWDRRHGRAREVVEQTPPPEIPPVSGEMPVNNAIDRFVGHKIEAARAAAAQPAAGSGNFHRDILPILQNHCFSCHGRQAKGGLRLDRRQAALAGGESGEPALVPGDPDGSLMLQLIRGDDTGQVMPPIGDRLTGEEIARIARWIEQGADWPQQPLAEQVQVPPLTSDLAFLRRVTLDTVGVVPSLEEIRAFQADGNPDKRARAIDRLLDDPRWADHWVGYWQDVLAENPSIINPTLNNTGPFRWWIYESFLDNKPMDLWVTELVLMQGSVYGGGPGGFALATENDVPMAEKANIVASAFLATQMKCARCHDAPYHRSTQRELFSLAAMLAESPLAVPKTSSVPQDQLAGRSLIQVTLPPGAEVAPAWPFADWVDPAQEAELVGSGASARQRLAALITSPHNSRFSQVLVNRLWQRYLGRGLVEPLDDWEDAAPSHPELLGYLARELVLHGYDLKHVARLIFNSHAYQRQSLAHEPSNGLFAAPARRQQSAEQLVDSLFVAFGQPLETEPLNLDLNSGRSIQVSLNLGRPARAWQFASTSTDRDRASLVLPRVQAVVDVLTAFGWRPSRQEPVSDRRTAMHVLQPAALAHGTMGVWLTRLSEESEITQLCLQDQPLEALMEAVFLRVLTRLPTEEERDTFGELLAAGYDQRVAGPPDAAAVLPDRQPRPYVTWANHLVPEATEVKLREEKEARAGPPPTARLADDWRVRMEDMLWALLNCPETVLIP